MVKKVVLILTLVLLCFCGNAQLKIHTAPDNGAFLPRDIKTNTADFILNAEVIQAMYHTAHIDVYRSGKVIKSQKFKLNYIKGKAPIKFSEPLTAGKYKYSVQINLYGKDTVSRNINGIVVGDMYMVQGQSNAVAASYSNFDLSYLDTFIRSYGTCSRTSSNVIADSSWHDANPIFTSRSGSIGQWAGVMAKNLLDSFGIPICILNGAVGGTRVIQHQPNLSNREDLNTIYGRLLYRMNKANLANKVRAILYFQGESDGWNAVQHDTLFRKLYRYWEQDYRGFERLYVVQVRQGCGSPSLELRDKQRKFRTLGRTTVVSANGLNAHDGCHYRFNEGYELLGSQMAALLGRDFYGTKRANVDPPNIKSCYYNNAKQTEIILEMLHPEDSVFVDDNFESLFIIEGDNSVVITKGELIDNKIILHINKSSCSITGLSYDGLRGNRPWVKNKTRMGLVSFFNVPIKRYAVSTSYSTCLDVPIVLKAPFVKGCTYKWIRNRDKHTVTGIQYYHDLNTTESYTLEIHYDKSVCDSVDRYQVGVWVDPANRDLLKERYTVCKGDSIFVEPNPTSYKSFEWYDGSRFNHSFVFKGEAKTGKLLLKATSSLGCVYHDTTEVFVSNPKVSLPLDFSICYNQDTLLSVPFGFDAYYWNGKKGGNSIRVETGNWEVRVKDTLHCEATDTVLVTSFTRKDKIAPYGIVCVNEFFNLVKPKSFLDWKINGVKQDSVLRLSKSGQYVFEVLDDNKCIYQDVFRLDSLTLPYFNLGKDTGFCKGKSVHFKLPEGNENYYWNGVEEKFAFKTVRMKGIQVAKVMNSKGCFYNDTVFVEEYELPSLMDFHDTIMCHDSTWKMELPKQVSYLINGIVAKEDFIFDAKGSFLIEAKNNRGCENKKRMNVYYQDCFVDLKEINTARFNVFPNPSMSGMFSLHCLNNMGLGFLYDINGKLILKQEILSGKNTIDLTNYPDGLYILNVKGKVTKLVKNEY